MNSNPRLLYAVTPALTTSGGVSVLVRSLIKHFSKNYRIYLLSNDRPDDLSRDEIYPHLTGHIEWNPPKGHLRPAYLRYTKDVAKKIKDQQIDCVHFHSGFYGWGNRFPGLSLPRHLRKLGIPCIWTTHSGLQLMVGFSNPKLPLLLKLPLFVAAWLGKCDQLRNTNCEVTVSKDVLNKLRRFWFNRSSNCLQIYHSSIEAGSPPALPRQKTILNVGYISYTKRQDLLVKAFLKIADRYADHEVLLVGNDNADGCMAEIQRMLADAPAKDRIRFLGDRDDVGALMQACAVYVHCSDVEGMPLALQEAMYYQCPVIASDIPAHRELLEFPDGGLLFERGDADQLATQLNYLLSNGYLRDQMGSKAIATVLERKMTCSAMLAGYALLYDQVLKFRSGTF